MSSVGIGFVVLWMIVGFFVLRFIAVRVFFETGRAEIVALAVVLAFTAGAVWPFSERIGSTAGGSVAPPVAAGVPGPPVAAAGSPPQAAAANMRDVSGRCRDATKISPGGIGSLDMVHGVASATPIDDGGSLRAKDGFVLVGWAGNLTHDGPARAVCLVVDGRVDVHAVATYGGARADVAAAYHAPGLGQTAFQIVVSPGAVAAGRHRIEVAVESAGAGFNFIPGMRTIAFR